ncbi:MAG: hypothetical protein QW404_01795 [Candidatus Nanoarchaeia archaeon]
MSKRGQLTVFMIIGVVLVVVIAIMVVYRSAITETINKEVLQKEVSLPPDVQKVRDYVQDCIEDASPMLLYQIGAQGGLLVFTENKGFTKDDVYIAYGYYKNKNVLPSLGDFENDYAKFMNNYLPICLSAGEFGKLEVVPLKPSTNLEFFDDKVRVTVDYPLTVNQEGGVYNLRDAYKVEYPLRIKFMHDIGDRIIKKVESDPKNIDISYLLDLGVDVTIYPYDKDVIIYSIQDTKSVVGDTPYVYRFVVRFGA